MHLADWRSRAMLSRYAASAADEGTGRSPPAQPGGSTVTSVVLRLVCDRCGNAVVGEAPPGERYFE